MHPVRVAEARVCVALVCCICVSPVSAWPIPGSGPGDGSFVCVLLCWVWYFSFLVSVHGRLGFPKRLTHPGTLVCDPCRSNQMHQLQGLHQASISGHAVEQASLLQELRGGATFSDFSSVQDDHPARGGDASMSGRECIGTSCPQEPI